MSITPPLTTNSADLSHTDALILAGGLGTRLRSVVADQQKAFAAVDAQPFAARLLRHLQAAGVQRVVFALGHLAERALPWIEQWRNETSLELVASIEPGPLGTGGALRHALPLLRSQTIIAANGDSFVAADLATLLRRHRQSHKAATLTAVRVGDAARYGCLDLDPAGQQVVAFREKDPLATGPAWINAGFYALQREVIASIPPDTAASLERDIFPRYLPDGLGAYCVDQPFIDIGTPESFRAAQHFFQS